jgi:hypothetical protein
MNRYTMRALLTKVHNVQVSDCGLQANQGEAPFDGDKRRLDFVLAKL